MPHAGSRPHTVMAQGTEGTMLLTNHVLSGALIGALVRLPVPAFALGVASHFALDTVPHWGPFRERHALLRVAVPDGLTALAALTAFAAAAPPHRRLTLTAAMLGAALPDADKPAQPAVRPFPVPPRRGPLPQPHPGRVARPLPGGSHHRHRPRADRCTGAGLWAGDLIRSQLSRAPPGERPVHPAPLHAAGARKRSCGVRGGRPPRRSTAGPGRCRCVSRTLGPGCPGSGRTG